MKIANYIGAEGDCITIEKPTDLYPLLDWAQTQMMGMADGFSKGSRESERCAVFISHLMELCEKEGFGDYDDVDTIEYS